MLFVPFLSVVVLTSSGSGAFLAVTPDEALSRSPFASVDELVPTHLRPRRPATKPDRTRVLGGARPDRIVLKFREGVKVRRDHGAWVADGPGLDEVERMLETQAPGAGVERLFRRSERGYDAARRRGQLRTGQALADLNNYYLLWVDSPATAARAATLCDALNAHDLVEIAYVPGFASDPDNCVDVKPATPSWEDQQDYRDPAPDGVDVDAAWDFGDRGRGDRDYWIVDVEQGWNTDHEDMNFDVGDVLNPPYDGEKRDHGTAVISEIVGCDNGIGVTGLTPDAQMKTVDWNSEISKAAALDVAASFLAPGEIYLIEIQMSGGCGLVPVEYEQANFDAIQTHTANGIIVVAAGGNGTQDLDDVGCYGQLFDRDFRDSGAIIVGAGTPLVHAPESFTNYGSRIDCQGVGSRVYAAAYGDLWQLGGIDQEYTATFSGTSSASPIVTACAAQTYLLNHERYGRNLTPVQVRKMLSAYGTPQGRPLTKHIGVLPDMAEITENLAPGQGFIVEADVNQLSVAPGGGVTVSGELTNLTPDRADVEVWVEAIRVGEERWAEGVDILGPLVVSLEPESTFGRDVRIKVPSAAPAGEYVMGVFVGDHPDAISSATYLHVRVE